MKGFKFRLQSILGIKEKLEQQAKIILSEENAKLNQEQLKLQNLFKDKKNILQKMKDSFTGTIDIISFDAYRNYSLKVDDMIKEQKVVIEKQLIVVTEAREKLATIVKERKALEKLKEKEIEVYNREMQLAEDKQIDELVTYKFGKR